MTEINGSSGEVDVLTWMGRAALELIGQGGLGYSFDPLTSDVRDSYGLALKTVQYVHPLGSSASRSLISMLDRPSRAAVYGSCSHHMCIG